MKKKSKKETYNHSFHVRSEIPQYQIVNGEVVARTQEQKILAKMASHPDKWFTEYDFENDNMLITSIRRALCNLKKRGLIISCDKNEKPIGRYGISIFKYKIADITNNKTENIL